MLQAQVAGAGNGVVFLPFFGGAVPAWSEQAIQHREENGTLDGKLKPVVFQQSGQNLID